MATPTHRRLAALCAAAALAVGLAACGSGSSSDGGGTTTTTAAASTTSAPDKADGSGDDTPSSTIGTGTADAGEPSTAEPMPSKGCGTSTTKAVELEKRTLPNSDRWYLLTTPKAHDGSTPLPLVLDFHGLSEGAEVHRMMTSFSPKAQEDGFIVAFPNGTGSPVRWQVAADRTANPDLVYTGAVLDQLEADLCVDTSRVYATGLSNGAMISSAIGCTMADRFAAIAPVAGVLDPTGCPKGRALPVLTFHGTDDPILLFNGGVGARLNNTLGKTSGNDTGTTIPEAPLAKADLDGAGYPASAAAWAKRNGCTGDPTDTKITDTVIQRTWDCPGDAPVVFDIIEGGGHSWPGSEFSANIAKIVGPTDMSIDATDLIWSFFTRFTVPAR